MTWQQVVGLGLVCMAVAQVIGFIVTLIDSAQIDHLKSQVRRLESMAHPPVTIDLDRMEHENEQLRRRINRLENSKRVFGNDG